MSLSGSTYWDEARKNTGVLETWLIQLYYDNESSFIGLSDKDITVDSVNYNGSVLDFGTIRNSIDLTRSASSTDNVDIEVVNRYKNLSFAAELVFGSRDYLNRKVNIYSRMGDATAIADCQLLDEYRLYNISQNKETAVLHLEKKSVWDHVSVPQQKYGNIYFPVAYGDFKVPSDSITSDNKVEGNDSDFSHATRHSYEADPGNPPTFWDIDTTVADKLYLALTAADIMGVRNTFASNLFSGSTAYNVSVKVRIASGSGAKLVIGGASSTNFEITATGTEATYTGSFTMAVAATQLYIWGVADVGTTSQAWEVDDLVITYAGTDIVTSTKEMYPTTYLPKESGGTRFAFAVADVTAASGAEPYLYDSTLDLLQKMVNGSTATTATTNGDYIYFTDLDREAVLRAERYSNAHADYSNEDNLIDGDISTYTDVDIVYTQATGTVTKSITLHFPELTETTANAVLYVKGSWEITSVSGAGTYNVDISIDVSGGNIVGEAGVDETEGSQKLGIINKEPFTSDVGITLEYEDVTPSYGDITIDCNVFENSSGGTHSTTVNFRIYDAYFTVDITPDYSGDPQAEAIEKRRIVTHGYNIGHGEINESHSGGIQWLTDRQENEAQQSNICTAVDGFSQGYNGGSGLAENVHEVFRDLLDRFAGFDVADGSLTGWSALDTVRSDWAVRWWQSEPRSLKKILDKLQFEGCFIFKFYGSGGKFIYLKADPSGDSIATINDTDYSDISITLSDFSDLITHTEYNYERHPATNGYRSSSTYTNSGSRGDWWPGTIAPEENKKQTNLEFLVKNPYNSETDSNADDCHALYYDNINADPKPIVRCNIVNKALWNLEDGDIVQFNTAFATFNPDAIQPFGYSWADIYFMITATERTLNNLKIEARFVYTI